MTNAEAERRLHELMSDRRDDVVEIALSARRAVRNAARPCGEIIYATYAISSVHTFTGKLGQAFIHIATYANHVNLGFNRGVELADPDSLLQGTGKLIRHIRLDNKRDVRKKPIKSLILAAIQQGRDMAETRGMPDEFFIRLA